MKNADETAKALVTLLNNAETDFERHRIEVLIRDLLEPPTFSQVDETHQEFNGKIYGQTTRSKHSRKKPLYYRVQSQIHRDIWEYYKGTIPQGDFVIHHKDGNPENNDIENLVLMSNSEHLRVHHSKGKPIAKPKDKVFICQNCGKEYTTKFLGHNKYCSPICKHQAKYKRDMIEKVCEYCGKKFVTNKYNDARFCSRECVNNAVVIVPHEIRKCLYCGKEFEVKKTASKKFCSNSCSNKYHHKDCHEIRHCKWCGKEFEVVKSSKKQFCNSSCATKYQFRK